MFSCIVFFSFVFFMIFSKIIFIDFIFLILSWLRITIVYFLTKHYRLLQCFLIFFSFFLMNLFLNYFCLFYFFNVKLVKNLACSLIFLESIVDCNSVSPYNCFLKKIYDFFYKSMTMNKHAISPWQRTGMTTSNI
jgi:hypothetical protein